MNETRKSFEDPVLQRLRSYFQRPGAASPREILHSDPQVHANALARRDSLREAAVLIPIVKPTANDPGSIILTVRSARLSSHAGQISLPGGSRSPQDRDIIATALRESAEETGIKAEHVEVLGQLGEILLPSGFRVTPVVGLLSPGFDLVPCPMEVDEIFHAPINLLLDPTAYQEATWEYANRPRRILELNYRQYRIWGATAVILQHLAKEINGNVAENSIR